MNCPKCGNELAPNTEVCEKCKEAVAQPAPSAPQKQKKGKKNLALKITAIVLAVIVFLTGGLFITDAIIFSTESKKGDFVTDFPILKQKTDLLVYDAEKFPYENYNIKVDRFKTGKVFKSSTFSSFENIINEQSNNPIFSIDFKEDGKYQITLEGIVAERTQAVTESTTKKEEPKTIVIIVIVDNDNEKAVDKVTINSKEGDEPIKDLNSVSQNPAGFIEASQADFDELERTLNDLFSLFYDPTYDCETADLSYVLDAMWMCGGVYSHYFGECEYEGDYEKLPEEDVKWICENIYNIKYDTNIEYNDYSYQYRDGYFYIGSYDVGGNEWDEYEVSGYNVVNDRYEIIIDIFRHSYETEDVVFVSKLEITAEIKIFEGKKYWSLYKVENYVQDGSSAPNEQGEEKDDLVFETPPVNNSANVGEYITFGKYEQDNNTANGAEDIEWLVLDVKDGKALVISKYALDCKQYNEEDSDITWETCTLRKWLNNDFINTAFTSAEKAKIPTVTVSTEENPDYGENTDPGNATQDKVYLLSINEATRYFASATERECKPTKYTEANGAYVQDGNCFWWLRSPGYLQSSAAQVFLYGSVMTDGHSVDTDNTAVRPVMWVDIG